MLMRVGPTIGPVERIPKNRAITLSLAVRPNGPAPDTASLKRELSKKYPVGRIGTVGKNPPDPDGSIRLIIIVYLVKEVLGPTLRQIVKDAYAYLKKQMRKKNAKRLAVPPGFIHNGAPRKKQRKKNLPKSNT